MSYFGTADDDFDPPDGNYEIEIYDASAFTGQDGREWAKAVLSITSGEHQGRRFDHFMNLNNPVGLGIAQEALLGYGLNTEEVENFGDLQSAMPGLLGTRADVSVSHKNGYKNIRVNRALTGASDIPEDINPNQQTFAAKAAGNGDKADDDSIPF